MPFLLDAGIGWCQTLEHFLFLCILGQRSVSPSCKVMSPTQLIACVLHVHAVYNVASFTTPSIITGDGPVMVGRNAQDEC